MFYLWKGGKFAALGKAQKTRHNNNSALSTEKCKTAAEIFSLHVVDANATSKYILDIL